MLNIAPSDSWIDKLTSISDLNDWLVLDDKVCKPSASSYRINLSNNLNNKLCFWRRWLCRLCCCCCGSCKFWVFILVFAIFFYKWSITRADKLICLRSCLNEPIDKPVRQPYSHVEKQRFKFIPIRTRSRCIFIISRKKIYCSSEVIVIV